MKKFKYNRKKIEKYFKNILSDKIIAINNALTLNNSIRFLINKFLEFENS